MPRPTGASGCLSSAEICWFGVAAADIPLWREAARPFVERALRHGNGEFSAADIEAALGTRAMQLWLMRGRDGGPICGALITEIANYPRRRTAILRLFAADRGLRAAWRPLLPVVEAWARAQGCGGIEVFGRPGWTRILDYEPTHVVLRKELKHE